MLYKTYHLNDLDNKKTLGECKGQICIVGRHAVGQ